MSVLDVHGILSLNLSHDHIVGNHLIVVDKWAEQVLFSKFVKFFCVFFKFFFIWGVCNSTQMVGEKGVHGLRVDSGGNRANLRLCDDRNTGIKGQEHF